MNATKNFDDIRVERYLQRRNELHKNGRSATEEEQDEKKEE
jgi:hypothetical protein